MKIGNILIVFGFIIMLSFLVLTGYSVYKNNVVEGFSEQMAYLKKSNLYGEFVYIGAFIVILGIFLSKKNKKEKK